MTTPTEKEQEIWSFVFQMEYNARIDPMSDVIKSANRAADAFRARFGGTSDYEKRVEEMAGDYPACKCRACQPNSSLNIYICDKCHMAGCKRVINHANECTNIDEMKITGERVLYRDDFKQGENPSELSIVGDGISFWISGGTLNRGFTKIERVAGDWGKNGIIKRAIIGPIQYDIQWASLSTGVMTKRNQDRSADNSKGASKV